MIYAIGDIHGCFSAFEKIIESIAPHPDDTLVLLGDYLDRGPGSKQVLDWMIKHRDICRTHYLRGNHDIMMLDARENDRDFQFWLTYGGRKTLASYDLTPGPGWEQRIPREHWELLENLAPYVELDAYIFVHAGMKAGLAPHQQTDHALFWEKYPRPRPYDSNRTLICGHTSRKNGKIHDFGHTICLDTYAYGGQWLSCLALETREFWQANQKGEMRRGHLSKHA